MVILPHLRSIRFGALVLIGLCTSTWGHAGAAHAATPPDRLAILQLLRQDRFDELEARLKRYTDRYRAGRTSDEFVEQAYRAFASADPAVEQKLDAWTAARPKSPAARMARALFYLNLATVSRGQALARNTPKVRFRDMRDYTGKSAADLKAVLERDPQFGIAYATLIQIAMMIGHHRAADAVNNKGLEMDPRSTLIRWRYLYSLTPWWRSVRSRPRIASALARHVLKGLLREWAVPEREPEVPATIERQLASIDSASIENPALEPLKGFGDYVIAELLGRRGRRQEAIDYYERALRYGPYWYYLQRQGENFKRLELYRDAAKSFTQALNVRPQVSDVLGDRASVKRKLGQFDSALMDLDMALSLSPRDPYILLELAYTLREAKRYDGVLPALDQAMLYGAHNEYIRDTRGRFLLYQLKRPADAIADLRRATELNPRSKQYWYNYGLALYRTKSCKASDALDAYLELCEAGAECWDQAMEWAAHIAELLKEPKVCPTREAEWREDGHDGHR